MSMKHLLACRCSLQNRIFYLRYSTALIPWSPQKDPHWVGELHEIFLFKCCLSIEKVERQRQNTSCHLKSKDLEHSILFEFPEFQLLFISFTHLGPESPDEFFNQLDVWSFACIWHRSYDRFTLIFAHAH